MKFVPARRADRILSVLLVMADMASIPLVFITTWFIRTKLLVHALPAFHHQFSTYLPALPAVMLLWVATYARAGLYRPRRFLGSMGELQTLLKAILYLAIFLMATSYLVRMDYSRIMLFLFIIIAIPISSVSRAVARKLAQILAPVNQVPRILVVGTGEVASRVVTALGRLPGRAPEIVGIISTNGYEETEFQGVPVVADLDAIIDTIGSLRADEVFFAAPEVDRSRILGIISSVTDSDIHFRLVTDLFEIAIGGTDLDDLARLPIIEIGYGEPGTLHRITKRIMDIAVSIFLLVLFLPLMLVVYLVLLLGSRGSPIFTQKRVGLKGRVFTLYKFRTMKPDSDEYEVAPLSIDDPRVTRIGRFLRRTSLDEFPQLINVLKGEMSLVGPRPEMPFIVKDYNSWQRHRMDVKPGLTGMWQIMGRKELPLHENLEYDYYYIRNQSLMLDFTILMRTVATIFRGRGAY